jgi:hypothetical protein
MRIVGELMFKCPKNHRFVSWLECDNCSFLIERRTEKVKGLSFDVVYCSYGGKDGES